MKERPILFSGPMVRAILAGTKTQTRRVVKYIPALGEPEQWCHRAPTSALRKLIGDYANFCHYGRPGERLWVRETFRQSDGSMSVHYRADEDEVSGGPWRPSIFMPRWASRLSLEITEIRVQRLQTISEEDARAEGVEHYKPAEGDGGAREGPAWNRIQFSHLWDEINGKRAPWASNPWVWAITFRRIE